MVMVVVVAAVFSLWAFVLVAVIPASSKVKVPFCRNSLIYNRSVFSAVAFNDDESVFSLVVSSVFI